MKITGSSIAAYYAGNAVLNADRAQARSQETRPVQHLRAVQSSKPPSEQILEGELLEEKRRRAAADDTQGQYQGREYTSQQQGSASSASGTQFSRGVQEYQNTARLDGFASAAEIHLIDIYV